MCARGLSLVRFRQNTAFICMYTSSCVHIQYMYIYTHITRASFFQGGSLQVAPIYIYTYIHPIAHGVSVLQSQNSIDDLVLYGSFASFRWKETNHSKIGHCDGMLLQIQYAAYMYTHTKCARGLSWADVCDAYIHMYTRFRHPALSASTTIANVIELHIFAYHSSFEKNKKLNPTSWSSIFRSHREKSPGARGDLDWGSMTCITRRSSTSRSTQFPLAHGERASLLFFLLHDNS